MKGLDINRQFNMILRAISAIILLLVPIYFGYLGKTTEMGLLIVSGFLGLVFSSLDKFESFKAGGVEAKLRYEQIKAVLEKEIEPEYSNETESSDINNPNLKLVPENAQSVLTALNNSDYTWRYVSGISQSIKLDRIDVKAALKWLFEHGYVKKSIGKNGQIWTVTSEGRNLYVRIRFKDVQGGVVPA
ncbi:hypothetical protein [Aliivibrio fischeri]|uniref:hypothetical protein n=1 Tax=Aliivibrio fischeri TaxID=668 RepID=UPI001F2250CA|nr:hypothetical protein [Aliivibrio fischeri]